MDKTTNFEEGSRSPRSSHSSIFLEVPKFGDKVKRQSIHGITEEMDVIKPHEQMAQLNLVEKKFLLAVERGDIVTTTMLLIETQGIEDENKNRLNINCVDPLGRSAIVIAIDNENLEMLKLLVENNVDTTDALLYAISEQFVEAVVLLLEHEEMHKNEGDVKNKMSWESRPRDTTIFSPDITPLILAAHRNNYEIIKILLDKGATVDLPHDIKCGCRECVIAQIDDSLKHSCSRINAYRALSSPSLIALSSKDPILTAFELSWELRRLSYIEHEFKSEYKELRYKCQDFATALLDHTQTSFELQVLLNRNTQGKTILLEEKSHLSRLKLAIKLKQKKFVAHPNVQQLLASIWYEGLPGFRRKNAYLQMLEVIRFLLLFPLLSLMYILFPESKAGQILRKPFIKFICHSASCLFFLILLIISSIEKNSSSKQWEFSQSSHNQSINSTDICKTINSTISANQKYAETDYDMIKNGGLPAPVEWLLIIWIFALIWRQMKELYKSKFREYIADMWKIVDILTNSLYCATIIFRIIIFLKTPKSSLVNSPPRQCWETWDLLLISEASLATANIFSSLKLIHRFSVNPYLGPLQIVLSRMIMDIVKFFLIYVLVLFAFACGLNQLLGCYARLQRIACDQGIDKDKDICEYKEFRKFISLFETIQTLFWASFGVIDLRIFKLHGIGRFTEFWAMLIFGTHCVISIVVLLNLLIAMMSNSYEHIFERSDTEWKYARSKLWISYFEEGFTLSPPFNIIPSKKSICHMMQRIKHMCCCRKISAYERKRNEFNMTIRQLVVNNNLYENVVKDLVRRYVTSEQRNVSKHGVAMEDDVNEVKQDISALRCEIAEVLNSSGLKIDTKANEKSGKMGKRNRLKERRLMNGINRKELRSVDSTETLFESLYLPNYNENETRPASAEYAVRKGSRSMFSTIVPSILHRIPHKPVKRKKHMKKSQFAQSMGCNLNAPSVTCEIGKSALSLTNLGKNIPDNQKIPVEL